MPGWFPAGADSWLLVVDLLTERGEPWPYELILDDLAWWADQQRFSGNRRPGRPTLARRWMVPDRMARKALKDPAWRNRQKGNVQPASSERPADVQPMSSERPASATTKPDNGAKMSSERPADVQPLSSERPADVLTRVSSPTPTPSTHTEDNTVCPAWFRKMLTARSRKHIAALGTPDELFGAVGQALQAWRGDLAAPRKTPSVPVLALMDAMAEEWADFPHPIAERRKHVADAASLIAEACMRCPHGVFARDVRAEGWAEGTNRSRDAGIVFRVKKWDYRLEVARAWDQAGRPDTMAPKPAAEGTGTTMLEMARRHFGRQDRLVLEG